MCRRHLAGEDLGDAKVTNLDDIPPLVQHDVLGLEVSVEDVEGVHVVQGNHNLGKDLQYVLLLHELAVPVLEVVKQGTTCVCARACVCVCVCVCVVGTQESRHMTITPTEGGQGGCPQSVLYIRKITSRGGEYSKGVMSPPPPPPPPPLCSSPPQMPPSMLSVLHQQHMQHLPGAYSITIMRDWSWRKLPS